MSYSSSSPGGMASLLLTLRPQQNRIDGCRRFVSCVATDWITRSFDIGLDQVTHCFHDSTNLIRDKAVTVIIISC